MRILKLVIIPVIILTMVIFPISVGLKTEAKALTNNERVALYSPAFWAWQASQWASMGMQAQNLGEAINYVNRNGDIDAYLNESWNRFQSEVQDKKRTLDTYFKATAGFWKSLFSGDLNIVGMQEMAEGSINTESEYYIYEGINFRNFPAIVVEQYDYRFYPQMETSIVDNESVIWNQFKNHLMADLTVGNDIYTGAFYSYSTLQFNKNGSMWAATSPGAGIGDIESGFVYIVHWINQYGSIDELGRKYRVTAIPVAKWVDTNGNQRVYSEKFITIGPISNDEMETLRITLDQTIIGKEVEVTDDDYVGTIISDQYLTELQMMIENVVNGTSTLTDVDMPNIGTDVKVETNSKAIADAIPIQQVTAITTDLNFPQVEDFTLPYLITTKFPFSIPWDLSRAISMMQAPAVVPYFEVPFKFTRLGIDENVVIDLEQFSTIAKIFRWFTLASFILALILVTRMLIKG
jgi:hypothetical protein